MGNRWQPKNSSEHTVCIPVSANAPTTTPSPLPTLTNFQQVSSKNLFLSSDLVCFHVTETRINIGNNEKIKHKPQREKNICMFSWQWVKVSWHGFAKILKEIKSEKYSVSTCYKHDLCRIQLHSNILDLCEQLCRLTLGFHAIFPASFQDHQPYTMLKINQSSCDIECELMEAESWWWHNWHTWTRVCDWP